LRFSLELASRGARGHFAQNSKQENGMSQESFLKFATLSLGRRLPPRIRAGLANMAFNVARDRFTDLSNRYLFTPEMRRGLQFLKGRGFEPSFILDIGAYHGDWTRMARAVWPRCAVLMLEANSEKLPLLQQVANDVGGTVTHALLGQEDGKEVDFHVMESGSSVFEEHSPVGRSTLKQKTRSLDTILTDLPPPDLIKIDVQGYELEVFKGGEVALGAAQAVIIEVSLIEINEGAPLFHEVVDFMFQRGFVAFDIFEIHRRPLDNSMNQIDVVFVPVESPLRADKRHW
jgi:FkbM family methyltransferase